jgi:hypothetical protein
MFAHSTVSMSEDWRRIDALPRRTWSAEQIDGAVEHYTSIFRKSGGTMRLLPIQAMALHELRTCGGLLGPIPVGEGKTLITLLAPSITGAKKPVLLLPSGLVDKTMRDREALSLHWKIPHCTQIIGYEALSREVSANLLAVKCPDLLMGDEAHRLKNLDAAVTRRVERFMDARPDTPCVFLSGTLFKDDLRDMAHLARWALKDGAPVPFEQGALIEWSEALKVQKNPLKAWHPGPLLRFAIDEDKGDNEIVTARHGYRRRFRETPGVIMPVRESEVSCSLRINGIVHPVSDVTECNYGPLRGQWTTPDGWTFTEAVEAWRHARELSLGLHYIWDPRPPSDWLAARAEYHAWVRYVKERMQDGAHLDTELQVRNWCAVASVARPRDFREYLAWMRVKDSFTPNAVAVWHDYSAIETVEKWAKKSPGIVWSEHAFFGREVSKRTGLTYYGEEGYSDAGEYIEKADPRKSAIASRRANSTGRNIQTIWSRALVTCPLSGDDAWEQLIGRLHRQGQLADEVTFDCLIGCFETWRAIERARASALAVRQTTGASRKLLLADITWPRENEIEGFGRLPRWIPQSEGFDEADAA